MKPILVFGTISDAGKTSIVMALCRIFADLGVRVAPFKVQNVSNNSSVTIEKREISRAQCFQAEAARVDTRHTKKTQLTHLQIWCVKIWIQLRFCSCNQCIYSSSIRQRHIFKSCIFQLLQCNSFTHHMIFRFIIEQMNNPMLQ